MVVERVFRTFVESGSVEIGDRSLREIMEDYRTVVINTLGPEDAVVPTVLDHRDELLERAEREADSGYLELAVTFYALWIEHTVNVNLMTGLTRKGYSLQVIDPLIREINLRTKITALWIIAGFPPLSEEDLRLVEQISQARNSFVHYKWRAHDEATEESMKTQLRAIVERAGRLKASFDDSISKLYWNNREDEIISGFHEYRYNTHNDDEEPDDPSPSS